MSETLSRNKQLSILRRAAEIYRSNQANWVKGQWIIFSNQILSPGQAQANRQTINSAARIGVVRKFLKKKRPEQKCMVCLEGALMLALAEDSSISEDAQAFMLIPQFAEVVRRSDFSSFDPGFAEKAEVAGDLVALNDNVISYYGGPSEEKKRETAARVLDAAADKLAVSP